MCCLGSTQQSGSPQTSDIDDEKNCIEWQRTGFVGFSLGIYRKRAVMNYKLTCMASQYIQSTLSGMGTVLGLGLVSWKGLVSVGT